MPMNKARGNMYPWVTHTHAHLGGECPHKCSYCYVNDLIPKRFRAGGPGRPKTFVGPLRIIPGAMNVRYGIGNTIFVDHCNDLFAEDVPADVIGRVLDHCARWPFNTYVYQTKNPERFATFLPYTQPDCILGCTIETNRDIPASISAAPRPIARAMAMRQLSGSRRLFVTVEPIMDFDVPVLGQWLRDIQPDFVNIGADSKENGLPEPSRDKVLSLIDVLCASGIEIVEKPSLGRLMNVSGVDNAKRLPRRKSV
ncbi:MAG: DUF5131 family protein [Armatimonadia bacterium]